MAEEAPPPQSDAITYTDEQLAEHDARQAQSDAIMAERSGESHPKAEEQHQKRGGKKSAE
jgi:hypothetical protein